MKKNGGGEGGTRKKQENLVNQDLKDKIKNSFNFKKKESTKQGNYNFISECNRFSDQLVQSDNIGPGTYIKDKGLIKGSFN